MKVEKRMKAAVWHGREDLRVEDVPEPTPGRDEVKIAVEWCGICGTDVGEYLYGPVLIKDAPVILGHEYAGTVVAKGEDVEEFRPGDRVTALNVRSCGRCGDACVVKNSMATGKKMALCENMNMTGLSSPGAFAEYVCIPSYIAVKLADGLSSEEGAMINPLSIGIHATKRGQLRIGESVAVIGDGTIGQLTLQACLAAGVRVAFLVGEQSSRMEIAKRCGATEVFHYRSKEIKNTIMERLGGQLPEVTFDCVGTQESLKGSVDLVRNGGRVMLVGIYDHPCQIDARDVVVQEKNLMGVLSQDYDDYDIGNCLIAQGKVRFEPLITARIGLEDLVERGIKELIHNKENQLRIMVHP
jgi:(R,R)-butanediol dehydrogenase/meso-butanediol dehydrogenase/diacetyl reductase